MKKPDPLRAGLLALPMLALLTVALAATAQPSQPAPDADTITVSFTFDYSENHTKPVGDGSIRFESQRSGTVTATLDRFQSSVGVDSFKLTRPAAGNISVQDSIITKTGGQEVVQKEHGSGRPSRDDTKITIQIDPKRGVYSFLISLKTDTLTEVTGPGSTRKDNNSAGFSWTSPQYPLPAKRGFLKGQEILTPGVGEGSLGSNFVPLGRAMKSMDGKTLASVALKWEIGTPPPKVPLELVVAIDGYETWLPEDDNSLAVVATLRRQDGKELKTGAGMIRFTLRETSTEKGDCLNHPVDAPDDPKAFDLKFVDGADAKPSDRDAQQAVTPIGKIWTRATAKIGSLDWGGTATLLVTALVPEEGEIQGKLETTGATEILLPKRSKGSKVGDEWKRLMKVVDLSDDDDSEKSAGNTNHGDGLTLYEEYRGVIARGKHSRESDDAKLDPMVKDVVVLMGEKRKVVAGATLNPIKGAAVLTARAGFRLFESAVQKAHVVEMNQTEAPSRIVNANSRKGRSQHGVLLFDGQNLPNGAVGVALPTDKMHKTPGLTEAVAIDFAGIVKGWNDQNAALRKFNETMPYTAADSGKNTVAHELAHACGAEHHGDVSGSGPATVLHESMVSPMYEVRDVDGGEVTERPWDFGEASIAMNFSRASGDPRCIMFYNDAYTWKLTLKPPGQGYRWDALRPMKPGTTLCTGSDGTPPNTTFGPAAAGRGNCRSLIKIKD